MTKNNLIDALAAAHRARRWGMEVEPWDALDEDVKNIWRAEMLDLWTALAGHVLEWLSDREGNYPNACGHLAAEWADTMMGAK
jgi:hypothetical protein